MAIKRMCLFLILIMLASAGIAVAAPVSSLDIFQSSYGDNSTSGTMIGLPPSPGDPTLIYSSNTKGSTIYSGNHVNYSMGRGYRSETGSVSYNDFPTFSGSPIGLSLDSGHSVAFTSGYASAADRVLRGSASVISSGAGFSESWSKGDIRNSFTVLPGSSDLALGDTARIRLNVRLDGSLSATGRSWPGSGHGFPHMQAGLSIKDPLVKYDTGEGWYTPKSVSFGADADIDAGPVNKDYWSHSFASDLSWSWGASTNTGIDLSDGGSNRVTSSSEDTDVSHNFYFDTGMLHLEFDAIVGHTLDFEAYLDVFSFADGIGSALSKFDTTFGPSIIDPNGTGTQIVWLLEEPTSSVPEPSTLLLLGTGIAGLGFLRKLRKS